MHDGRGFSAEKDLGRMNNILFGYSMKAGFGPINEKMVPCLMCFYCVIYINDIYG
jgi:hypothetical protein